MGANYSSSVHCAESGALSAMSDDPKERERKSSGQLKAERERVTGGRERSSGARPAPERTTGSQSIRDLAERERAETTFTGSGERARITGSQPVPRPSIPPERERVTQKMGQVRERTTGSVPV